MPNANKASTSDMVISGLSPPEKRELLTLLEEKERRRLSRRLYTYYPDTGPLRRELYTKHLEYFRSGASSRQRLMLAANRIGKTEGVGGYETALHLTGLYPHWWDGAKFSGPVRWWAAGKTNETTRDILQRKLLGEVVWEGGRKRVTGTGLIPGDYIGDIAWKQGVSDLIDTVKIKHSSGDWSLLGLKSYQQGRGAFEGTEQHGVWLDEEPPLDVYGECLIRTMTTRGLLLLTFTPLEGLSQVVLHFLPGGKLAEGAQDGGKYVVMATWDDAPHLDEATKKELWAEMPPHQRDARSKGVPQLGSGAIYPIAEDEITCTPFEIPEYWPRAYALDVGWNCTAAVWGAWDRETDTIYVYSVHRRGQAEPVIHADAIKGRGGWIPGVIDPAARGRAQKDGIQLLTTYQEHGLDIEPADNAVESGIYKTWQRLSNGRLKVFSTCGGWLEEYRLYRRDENGKIVKENDHLMDATRYLVMSGMARACTQPAYDDDYRPPITGRSKSGGY